MDLKQHPLSAAFPGMTETDHAALTADILAYGQREPITMFEGMILDGWHRYQSCIQIKEKPAFKALDADIDPVAFVKSHNLHRRHLSGSQRAIAVVACSRWAQSGRPSAINREPSSPLTKTQMAKEADVSTKTIQQAKTVIDAGLESKVVSGEMTVKKAAEQVNPPKPKAPPEEVKPEPEEPKEETVTISKESHEELKAVLSEYAAEAKAFEAVLDADDKLAEAAKQIRMLTAQVEAVRSQLSGAQNRENELKRLLKTRDRQISKLEKELSGYTVKLNSAGLPI